MKRVLCIVLDSVGCGHAPDADEFGDAGADTLGHLYERIPGFALPTLERLGLRHVMAQAAGLEHPERNAEGGWSVLTESSAGKDTTTGHWELAGAPQREPFAYFDHFPEDLVSAIAEEGKVSGFLGNRAASGTAIVDGLGSEHVASGQPILYTSADSVLQIAAHEDPAVFGLERLLALCAVARRVLDGKGIRVARVIARPFLGSPEEGFRRTANRRDFSLTPPPTALDELRQRGVITTGVGKIHDIFAGRGLDESHPTKDNAQGMATIDRLWTETATESTRRLIFVNLVDFDMLYGHRRDPEGYASSLREFDAWLAGFLPKIGKEDVLLITADHGNDPYFAGTDHTRERVPLLAVNPPMPLPPEAGFGFVADLWRAAFSG